MTAVMIDHTHSSFDNLSQVLDVQKQAFAENPMPNADERIAKLKKLNYAVLDYKDQLIEAVSADFSNRSSAETMMVEILAALEGIAYNKKHLRKWMKAQKRHVPLSLKPSRVEVRYQPLGVIGIVVPWNFPIFLGLSPLIGALAAGNRAMIKTSEFAPKTSTVMKEMLGSIFDENEVAVVEGDVEVSSAFTKLPFDHLVFTGATSVGKLVMKSAAENLTPVTLELGGKSPAIIHDSYSAKEAAKRLAFGKAINAGQVCVSPDYVFCHHSQVEEFCETFSDVFSSRYPSMKNNQDYTAIINERQLHRLQQYLQDAEDKGATLIEINPANEDFSGTRKMPMTLVLNPTNDMLVLQEEIFGPILPVITYSDMSEVTEYVQAGERPLALYYFDDDQRRANQLLDTTHSGGACINDSMIHVMADDIPFGGVGASGMGHYHGKEGFLNFSKAKGVVKKGKIDLASMIAAPWDNKMFNLLVKLRLWRYSR
ncbi:coniferyl-aldehyde dehydrogenase [Vibrio coralliilyticus]|uniref:coniferyl aldehyde dehydrogenase n=1 Tax=Vibrio coralliilyticus TaxID=190893 RepID=UPI000BAACDF3|nr:coniferyl aldehyde dehydrogenase [Vibrio coralliilyticus]PAU40169.1 coniferyl-aldehyde dehydrogenase [Vibrio coralliilyticus]